MTLFCHFVQKTHLCNSAFRALILFINHTLILCIKSLTVRLPSHFQLSSILVPPTLESFDKFDLSKHLSSPSLHLESLVFS